jgi:hypothetical protein
MKRIFSMFHLKPNEQRLLVLVMVALLAWSWVKHQRKRAVEERPPAAAAALPNE